MIGTEVAMVKENLNNYIMILLSSFSSWPRCQCEHILKVE